MCAHHFVEVNFNLSRCTLELLDQVKGIAEAAGQAFLILSAKDMAAKLFFDASYFD